MNRGGFLAFHQLQDCIYRTQWTFLASDVIADSFLLDTITGGFVA